MFDTVPKDRYKNVLRYPVAILRLLNDSSYPLRVNPLGHSITPVVLISSEGSLKDAQIRCIKGITNISDRTAIKIVFTMSNIPICFNSLIHFLTIS